MKKDKCSESFKHKYLIEQLNDEFLAEQFMYYLYIIYSPIIGTMKNEIKFGMLTVAIVAVAAAALTTVLDNIVQDASAERPFVPPGQDNPGHFPGQGQGGGGGSPGNSPPGNSPGGN